MKHSKNMFRVVAAMAVVAIATSCMRDPNDPGIQYAPEMYESIPYEPFKQVWDSITPFGNRQTMQVPPDGTIPRGGHGAFQFAAGDSVKLSPAVIAMVNPIESNESTLAKGKVLYERFCGICHGNTGKGNGKVADHDAINPPDLNSGKWVTYAPGQIYHTIMYGQGVMGSYASQLDHDERWMVVNYVISLRSPEGIVDSLATLPAADTTATDSGDHGM